MQNSPMGEWRVGGAGGIHRAARMIERSHDGDLADDTRGMIDEDEANSSGTLGRRRRADRTRRSQDA